MFANRLARVVITAFVLAAVHASVSAAECKPDTTATASRNRTLFSGVAAFHFDEVGRSVSVNGTPASLRGGSVDAEYSYFHRVNGISESHVDGKSSAPFVAPAVGVEVSLFKYVTAYIDAGHRFVGRLNTPGLSNSGLSGTYASFAMAFGKFR
jgi:hypothetical protein